MVLNLSLSVSSCRSEGCPQGVAFSGAQGGLPHHPQNQTHLICKHWHSTLIRHAAASCRFLIFFGPSWMQISSMLSPCCFCFCSCRLLRNCATKHMRKGYVCNYLHTLQKCALVGTVRIQIPLTEWHRACRVTPRHDCLLTCCNKLLWLIDISALLGPWHMRVAELAGPSTWKFLLR